MTASSLVIGLGNPGREYETTRHNAGFMLVDSLADQHQLHFTSTVKHSCLEAHSESIVLLKPQLFMNLSGSAVSEYLGFYKRTFQSFSQLVVAYDDLDLPLGSWKLVYGSGPKVHNGLNSVIAAFGTADFWHARLGTDARSAEGRIPGEKYVLQPIPPAEISQYEQMNQAVGNAIWQKLTES